MCTSFCGTFECDSCSHRERNDCSGCGRENQARLDRGDKPCGVYACAVSRDATQCMKCVDAVCPFIRDLETVVPIRAQFEKKRCYMKKLSEHFVGRVLPGSPVNDTKIPKRTIDRLQSYVLALDELTHMNAPYVSSSDISRKTGVKDYLIRRDLNQFGGFGRPSIGYSTKKLRDALSDILNLNQEKRVVWVGALHLAADPSLIERFAEYSFRIVAVLDADPQVFGGRIGEIEIDHLDRLAETVARTSATGAIIATPNGLAQGVANALVRAGIDGILNITTIGVTVPEQVCLKNVNIVSELLSLSFHCHKQSEARQRFARSMEQSLSESTENVTAAAAAAVVG